MRDRTPVTQLGAVLRAVAVAIAGVLPAFLVGALAVQMRQDLRIGVAAIGLATASLFMVSGSLARPCGSLVHRIGSRRALGLAAALSTAALVGVALAPTYWVLLAALLVGGLGNGLAQPAANMSLSELVTDVRLGLAFGIKQSAIPAATLLAGLAVPAIALTVGWRWAAALAALLALGVVVLSASTPRVPSRHSRHQEVVDKGLPRSGLVVLTIGGGLAAAASTSLGVFLVDAGVDAGLGPGDSGLLFAVSSVLGLIGRVGLGWLADRHPRRSLYATIATLLVLGAAGYGLLAAGTPATFVAGSLLAYGAGWTWTGLFHFAIVKDNRLRAAAATGFVQTGLSLGAALGPLAFGVVASATSYGTAWVWNAVLSVVAAATIRSGRRIVRRHRGLPVATLRLHRLRAASGTPPSREGGMRWQAGRGARRHWWTTEGTA